MTNRPPSKPYNSPNPTNRYTDNPHIIKHPQIASLRGPILSLQNQPTSLTHVPLSNRLTLLTANINTIKNSRRTRANLNQSLYAIYHLLNCLAPLALNTTEQGRKMEQSLTLYRHHNTTQLQTLIITYCTLIQTHRRIYR